MGHKAGDRVKKVQVWILSRDKKVLLLKTNAARGAFWQPVTGSVEEGEEVEAAALREAKEESGLTFMAPPKSLGFEFYFEAKWAKGKKVHETTFMLKWDGESKDAQIKLDPREHDSYVWAAPQDALKELKFESNAQALKLLMKKER